MQETTQETYRPRGAAKARQVIVMLDTPDNLEECEAELGLPVEELFTPLTRRAVKRPDAHFAIDNGAYSRFDPAGFERILLRHKNRQALCRFVALPDVVYSARKTLEQFEQWYSRTEGWKRALVAQDGIESLPVPWAQIDAMFIGGSTRFKRSKAAMDVINTAKTYGKWVHIGRVNTPGRFEYFEEIGADSSDGTGLARYTWMREAIRRGSPEPTLFT